MTREELIQAIPSIDQLYVLYSVHTRSPYVVCEEKTQDDAAVVYLDEVEAEQAARALTEEKKDVNALKMDDPSRILSTFTSFFLFGINAVEFHTGDGVIILQLNEFIRRHDLSDIPEDRRPVENPSLQLTMLYFMQEFRRGLENPDNEKLREMEEEMVVNVLRGKYLLPFRPGEGEMKDQVQLLMVKMQEDKYMIPVFTDNFEFTKFRGLDTSISISVATMDNLLALPIPDNSLGIVVNPAGVSLALTKDWMQRVRDTKATENV